MRHWSLTTDSPERTRELGRRIGELSSPGTVLLLCGDLGAGKTCMTQGLARGLGVPAGEAVTSPTFTLMNHHRGRLDLFHFDLYRLADPEELRELGFEESLRGGGVTVVEWADRFDLGVEALRITLDYRGEGRRELLLEARGDLHEALLDELCRAWLSD